jgi:hypothetical protein
VGAYLLGTATVGRLDLSPDVVERGTGLAQRGRRRAVDAEEAQQEVIGADVRVAETASLLLGEYDSAPGVISKHFEHEPASLEHRRDAQVRVGSTAWTMVRPV